MNTELVTARPRGRTRRQSARVQTPRPAENIRLRTAHARDAGALHALIDAHLAEGHLLPRSLEELTTHAPRFVVAVRAGRVVGCAELAPLSARVAEVRSLVVDRSSRSLNIGRSLVDELRRNASAGGYETLCAFTHDAAYFVRKGFTIVPHVWVPEKIALDCHQCALFRRCGQHAVVLSLRDALGSARDGHAPVR